MHDEATVIRRCRNSTLLFAAAFAGLAFAAWVFGSDGLGAFASLSALFAWSSAANWVHYASRSGGRVARALERCRKAIAHED